MSLAELRRVLAEAEKRKRDKLPYRARREAEKRATQGLQPSEPRLTPRQKRLEMHQRRLGITPASEVEDDTDDEGEHDSLPRLDAHLRKQLRLFASPSPWVRQLLVVSLGAVHASSLLLVANTLLRAQGELCARLMKSEPGALLEDVEGEDEEDEEVGIKRAKAAEAAYLPTLLRARAASGDELMQLTRLTRQARACFWPWCGGAGQVRQTGTVPREERTCYPRTSTRDALVPHQPHVNFLFALSLNSFANTGGCR